MKVAGSLHHEIPPMAGVPMSMASKKLRTASWAAGLKSAGFSDGAILGRRPSSMLVLSAKVGPSSSSSDESNETDQKKLSYKNT